MSSETGLDPRRDVFLPLGIRDRWQYEARVTLERPYGSPPSARDALECPFPATISYDLDIRDYILGHHISQFNENINTVYYPNLPCTLRRPLSSILVLTALQPTPPSNPLRVLSRNMEPADTHVRVMPYNSWERSCLMRSFTLQPTEPSSRGLKQSSGLRGSARTADNPSAWP